jgi:TetR/AcrR family transcriptional regulator, upper aerobic nicotinate degradation pathway regulator
MPAAPARKRAAAPQRSGVREQAAQATRDAILKAATKVFAKHGFAGGRVEEISRLAKSYDRMIYYYFGSKESLYIAVIEETYRRFNEAESRLVLDLTQPVQALREVIAFIWGYYQKNPEFITLLNNENLLRGRHIARANRAGEYSSPALSVLAQVLGSGADAGAFRPELRARDVYLMIAAMGYFYLSNRFTLSTFLGEDLEDAAALAHWQQFITDAVLRTVSAVPPEAPEVSVAPVASAPRMRRRPPDKGGPTAATAVPLPLVNRVPPLGTES